MSSAALSMIFIALNMFFAGAIGAESLPVPTPLIGAAAVVCIAFAVAAYFRFSLLKKRLLEAEVQLKEKEKIEEERARLESIINSAPVGYVMTIDGVVKEANEYVRQSLGTGLGDVFADYYVNPADRDALVELSERYSKAEGKIVKFRMKNGDIHRFVANTRKVAGRSGAYYSWNVDIEANELQRDNLEAAQHKMLEVSSTLRRVIDSAPIYFIICVEGRVVEANEAAKNESGVGKGSRIAEIFAEPESREALAERIKQERAISNEVIRIKLAGGGVKRYLANVAETDYEGREALVVWAVDIEESERKAEELKAAHENLRAMLEHVEKNEA